MAPFSPGSQTQGIPESVDDHLAQASEKKVFDDLDAHFGNMSLYGAQLSMQSPVPSTVRTSLNSPQASQWTNSWSNSRQSSQTSLPSHQTLFTGGHTRASSGANLSLMSPQSYPMLRQFSPIPLSSRASFPSTRPNMGSNARTNFFAAIPSSGPTIVDRMRRVSTEPPSVHQALTTTTSMSTRFEKAPTSAPPSCSETSQTRWTKPC